MTEHKFYDLFRDASKASNDLAEALRGTIRDFKAKHADITDPEIMDAIKMVELHRDQRRKAS